MEFQNYIRTNSEYDENDQKTSKIDHSSAGAIFAKEMLPFLWKPLAYCIAGHHSGLLNWNQEIDVSGDVQSRLKKQDLLEKIRPVIPNSIIQPNTLNAPCGKSIEPDYMHLWIRILFSCLVDADYLDTERFMNKELSEKRGRYKSILELEALFENFMQKIIASASKTRLNEIRRKVLEQCRLTGEMAPGFFSLNVPTGGGKTLSSMAWGLKHAICFKKSRIIYVIPYTNIITQTAHIFREVFGDENVIEHHSNIDEDTNSLKRKLASENWDAPIIVTTNVQLFESLYACRTSRCRKLHNIVNSIVILDEAQMLPPEFLKPIISVLNGLVKNFGVSVLLSTATQPTLIGKIGKDSNCFTGIQQDQFTEIIPDFPQLAKELKRVRIEMPKQPDITEDWSDIAEQLKSFNQVLCIVNTRKDCRYLFKLMPEGTIHLSRMMCSVHIMDTIEQIKEKLRKNEQVRVISTQLIEAGVDIDFPVVYRALAGLDSIAQSAGRCNREGKDKNLGLTKIFIAGKSNHSGLIRKGIDTTKELIYMMPEGDFLSPKMFTEYFELFYSKVSKFDKPEIEELLLMNAHDMNFQFASAAHNFKLIDNKDIKNIIVRYREGAELIELFKRKGPEAWLMRKLQRFTVSVYQKDFDELFKTGCIEEYHGCWLQTDPWLYNNQVGLAFDNEGIEETLLI